MNRSVAVVGASPDRRKFGNKAVRAYLAAGYDVFPVHPTEPAVEGRPAYKRVADIPRERLDRVALYVPPNVGLTVLDGLAGKPIGQLILNPGADSPEVVARAKELGLPAVQGCAIIMGGYRPQDFPDE
jgi:predicted CoA-binding protein